METARIHSIETFGTVDGPGIRFVIFLQGCPMRCQYCHNPDTWEIDVGQEVTADMLLAQYKKNKIYYSNGGITVSGGEPLLQLDFVIELFEKAKAKKISTCIDTSGITFRKNDAAFLQKLDRLLLVTDLILLDIKQVDPDAHMRLTGHPNHMILAFAQYLNEKNIPVIIRHVVVPTLTDTRESLLALGKFSSTMNNVISVELLPYHSMGKAKYDALHMDYPLKDIPDLDSKLITKYQNIVREGML